MMGPILVTGGAGFIGSNLVDRLAGEGHRITVLDNMARAGSKSNAAWLRLKYSDRVTFIAADIRDTAVLEPAVAEASAVFHFAAQVAVTTSLSDPKEDFSVNLAGTFGLLEALRRKPFTTPLLFASTNKVYGDLGDIALDCGESGYAPSEPQLKAHGVSEQRNLAFCTPYGCSKGAADQYVLDYAHSFGLPAAVMRMSCIYGPRQMGTEDQGWVAHFLIRALRGKTINIFGDGQQVRDILFVDDAIDAYIAAWRRIADIKGRAFNLGGGPANAVSLKSVLDFIEQRLGRKLDIIYEDWRAGDQRYYVSDTARAQRELRLAAAIPWREGIMRLLDWLRDSADSPAASAKQAEAAE